MKVYGNPCQPDFLKSKYAFTYLPYPDQSSETPWDEAPKREDGVAIWVCHSPPKGILDAVPVEGLTGCEVMLRKAREGRPAVCVFGHYHSSYGRRLERWGGEGQEVEIELEVKEGGAIDLTEDEELRGGDMTLFLNAAWMTMQKTKVEGRNRPWLVRMRVGQW